MFDIVLYIDSHPVLLFHYFCHSMSIVTIVFLILVINSRYFVPRNYNYIASLLNKHHSTQDWAYFCLRIEVLKVYYHESHKREIRNQFLWLGWGGRDTNTFENMVLKSLKYFNSRLTLYCDPLHGINNFIKLELV